MLLPSPPAIVSTAPRESPLPAIARGTATVATEARIDGANDATRSAYAAAVEAAMGEAGFTLLPGSPHAACVASLRVTRTVRGTARVGGKSGPIYPGGGTTFGNAVGMGITIPFGAAPSVGQIVATEMTLRLDRRGSKGTPWEGRAVTYRVAGSPGDDPGRVAKSLASAVLRNLDGPSGVLVSIP